MADRNPVKRIHKLPDNLVNQIAAGEVIERPASVVKELLENSLDAGATKIILEIEGGGSRLIRVNDNGYGIHHDDLLLAVDRHTTSKLDGGSDLCKIATLGFRGEALSSIASVSRFKLTSRQHGSNNGWCINFDTLSPKPAAHPVGTTVEVRDLFFKTPARRKFLRTEKTEFIHIHELVKRIALSRFNVAIQFLHEGRQLMSLTDDNKYPLRRVESVLGKRFLNESLMVEQQFDDMSLYGWAGSPEIARSQNDQQYFYLNGRIVKDKLINHAVRMAYEDKLHPGRHPAYVLFLKMDYAAADINVHPTKHEVRFRNARDVHDFIYGSLSRLLGEGRQQLIHEGDTRKMTVTGGNNISRSQNDSIREMKSSYGKTITEVVAAQERCEFGRPVAQIKGRFLITENADGIILHDINQMRELIAGIRLKRELETGEIKSRPILVPLVLTIEDNIFELLENHMPLLEKTGLSIRRISHISIQILTLPVLLPYVDALSLVKDVIAFLEMKKSGVPDIDEFLLLFARHVNDNSPVELNIHEMNSLLMDFFSMRDMIPDKQFIKTMRPFDMESLSKLFYGKY